MARSSLYSRITEAGRIVYRTANVRCDARKARPVTYPKKGWVSDKWLKPLAG